MSRFENTPHYLFVLAPRPITKFCAIFPAVQKCKQWALGNLVPSTARMAPFAKYLVALSGSFQQDATKQSDAGPTFFASGKPKEASAKRKRLHVLYIVSDILYHVKFRLHDSSFAAKLEPTLPALVCSAASFHHAPKHIGKIHRLISLWEEHEYFSPPFFAKLRAAVDENPSDTAQAPDPKTETLDSTARAARTGPFVLPAMHGDPSTPWYDLPAGNWLPVLEPNSTRPMNPAMIRPLQLASGPADAKLVDAVKKLLLDVDKIYAKDLGLDHASVDIGQMGERVELDELGEVVAEDTYYGWSRSFCEKMKTRRQGKNGQDRARSGRSSRSGSRSRSRSAAPRRGRNRDSSRESSRPAFKRRRMSSTSDPRNRSRSSSRSRSRSGEPNHARGRDYSRSPTRSRSRSDGRYRSRTPDRGSLQSQSRSRIPDYSVPLPGPPPSGLPPRPDLGMAFTLHHSGPDPNHFHQPPPQPRPPFGGRPPRAPQPNQFPGYPNPVPPPPPPNYQGQWPPPPPPMGNPGPGYFLEGQGPQPFLGGWGTAPPPQLPQGNFGTYGGRGGPDGPFRGNNSGGRGGYGRGGW
ncbi:hypothetical protein GQ53DRAFT_748614 [Thozetella sp. PMI_491]|nr:hypothetical protein GQ53DRAFT_748614 [Thozetella sp. PMI_491]